MNVISFFAGCGGLELGFETPGDLPRLVRLDNIRHTHFSRIVTSVDFVNAVRNGDRQVAQITFNDDIINIVAGMLEEKTEFVQTYFANQDFQNFVNARVFQAAVSQLSNR